MKHNMERDSMEKVTARPWEANTESDASMKRSLEVIRSGDKVVALTGHPDFDALPEDERKVNAALIVRAVNSYDALVESCEAALMEQVDDMGRKSETHLKLEAALKLAKGA